MRIYIIRRLLLMIPTLFLVTIIIFTLIRLIPGDIVDAIAGELAEQGGLMAVDRDAIIKELGLDAPIPTQYARWIGILPGVDGSFSGLLQGDFGTSMRKGLPVIDQLRKTLPVTFELGLMAFVIAQLIALPIGIFSALRQDTWGDHIGRSFAIMCIAVPGFWLATMTIILPALWWDYYPPVVYTSFTEDPMKNLQILIMPAIILGMVMSGGTMRMTRTMMLEVLRQDYIRTAWSKGLRERVVILRHALKNALIPVVTMVGPQLLVMIGGAVVIEQIFALPGVGRLGLDAITGRDYTLISGVMIIIGLTIMLTNLAVDITYCYLDPRIRYR